MHRCVDIKITSVQILHFTLFMTLFRRRIIRQCGVRVAYISRTESHSHSGITNKSQATAMRDIRIRHEFSAYFKHRISCPKETSTSDTHAGLQLANEQTCIGASSVRRWVKRFKEGYTDMTDLLVVVTREWPLPSKTQKKSTSPPENRSVAAREIETQRLE